MNRQTTLLAAVGAVLILALYWMFLLGPKRTELSETNDAITAAIDQQRTLTNRINALQDVRAAAPAAESRLAATEALLPSSAALPATLRQLQLAADESGLTLNTVSPGPPSPVTLANVAGGVSSMTLSVSMSGSYFQIVDFLRRIGDPQITPRAILWQSAAVGLGEYPELSLSLSGNMYILDRAAIVGGG